MKNLRRFLLALAALTFLAMPFTGCASSSGAQVPQLNLASLRQAAVDYVKSARLAVSVRKSGDGICLDFGIADSSGMVFVSTNGPALMHVDAPCWTLQDVTTALGLGMPGPLAPSATKSMPFAVYPMPDTAKVDTIIGGR